MYCDKLKVSTVSVSLFPPTPCLSQWFFSLFFSFSHMLFIFKTCQRGDWWVRTRYSFVITNIFLIIMIFFFLPLLEHACPFPFILIWQWCLTSVGHSQTSLQWALYTYIIKRSFWLQKPTGFSLDLTVLWSLSFVLLKLKACGICSRTSILFVTIFWIIQVRSVTLWEKEESLEEFWPCSPKPALRRFLALFFCSLKQARFEEKNVLHDCHYKARFPERV